MDIVDPGLARALERFERILTDRFPEQLAAQGPGLDDAGIDRLREAVAPYLLPAQVEQLYRWRSGGHLGVFGGWYQHRAEDLPDRYRFRVDELGECPLWLPVFDLQMVNVVTLDLPDHEPSDTSVWYGHTHDGFLLRLFDSIEALVLTVCDAADAGRLVVEPEGMFQGSLMLSVREEETAQIDETSDDDGDGWNRWRLARSPQAHGAEPALRGSTSRQPAADWLPEWTTASRRS